MRDDGGFRPSKELVVIRFDAVLESGTAGGAFVKLPDEVVELLGQGTKFRARGTIGGVAYQSSTMPAGSGRVCLGVHKSTRQAAGIGFGEQVCVEIEVDSSPREVIVPLELENTLVATGLREAFDRLAPSRRRELAAGVAEAKTPATRDRRVAKIVEALQAG